MAVTERSRVREGEGSMVPSPPVRDLAHAAARRLRARAHDRPDREHVPDLVHRRASGRLLPHELRHDLRRPGVPRGRHQHADRRGDLARVGAGARPDHRAHAPRAVPRARLRPDDRVGAARRADDRGRRRDAADLRAVGLPQLPGLPGPGPGQPAARRGVGVRADRLDGDRRRADAAHRRDRRHVEGPADRGL